jgi:hypothetical protein
MTEADRPSAEKTLLARSADGEEWELRIGVWPPEKAELAPWACKVEVTKLFSPAKSIYGADSWQAQVLAMRFAASLIQNFVTQGGAVFWLGDESGTQREPFEISDLIPSLPN